MITQEQVVAVMRDGAVVVGPEGQDLGRIRQVLVHALSGRPTWMTLSTTAPAGSDALVPLGAAALDEGRISVPYSAAVVRGAPKGRADDGPREGRLEGPYEADLLRYYGLGGVDAAPGEAASPLARREWRLPCTVGAVRLLRLELRAHLETAGLPAAEIGDLVLATSEAAENAVEHPRDRLAGYFDVSVDIAGAAVLIAVHDTGSWRDPVVGLGRGRGLLLMSNLSALTVTAGPDGTTVTLANGRAAPGSWSFRRRH